MSINRNLFLQGVGVHIAPSGSCCGLHVALELASINFVSLFQLASSGPVLSEDALAVADCSPASNQQQLFVIGLHPSHVAVQHCSPAAFVLALCHLLCSNSVLYSTSGSRRPLTPMPPPKPGGVLAGMAAAADASAARRSDDRQQQQDRQAATAAAGTGFFGSATAGAAAPAPGSFFAAPAGHTGSMFGGSAAAAAAAGTSGLFPGLAGRTGLAPARAAPFSTALGLGTPAGAVAATGAFGGGSRPGSSSDLPALLAAGPAAASKPLLGLPRVRPPAGKAPLMGAKRGAAAGRGTAGMRAGGAAAGAAAAAGGALRPMRSTPLKVGYGSFGGLGSKRGSEQQGPSALDLVAAGTAGVYVCRG